MGNLKKLRDEELQVGLRTEFVKQLHTVYDHVLTAELPVRIDELMRRLDGAIVLNSTAGVCPRNVCHFNFDK